MELNYSETDFTALTGMRNQRFDQLPYPQVLHLEWLAKEGDCYWLYEPVYANASVCAANTPGAPLGYTIIADGILLELYIEPPHQTRLLEIFHQLLQDQQLHAVLAQSFDGLIMKCCLNSHFQADTMGLVFNHYLPTESPAQIRYRRRPASTADRPLLLAQQDGLYESAEELDYMLDHGFIQLYLDDDILVGCGYLIRIHPNRNWYDIGMWVPTARRGQGIASCIIADLKAHCLRSGYQPVCACDADNKASQVTLEKNGFRTLHDLLLFPITGGD